MRLNSADRAELEHDAVERGFLGGLAGLPKPLAGDAIRLDDEMSRMLFHAQLEAQNPNGSDWDVKVAAYAWHMLRERIDVWEPDPQIWAEYDPTWQMKLEHEDDRGVGVLVYDTWCSPYELERYFVNPWLRCAAWIRAGQVERSGLRDRWSEGKGTGVGNFKANCSEVERWYLTQKPAIRWDSAANGRPGIGRMDYASGPVNGLIVETGNVFSWTEWLIRWDEINHIMVNAQLFKGMKSDLPDDRIRRKLAGRIYTKAQSFRETYLRKMVPAVAAMTGFSGDFLDR
jgi:hypothetical protein